LDTIRQSKKIFTIDVIAGADKKHMPAGSAIALPLFDPQETAKAFSVEFVEAKAATLRSTVFVSLAVCAAESFPDRVKEMIHAPIARSGLSSPREGGAIWYWRQMSRQAHQEESKIIDLKADVAALGS